MGDREEVQAKGGGGEGKEKGTAGKVGHTGVTLA